MTTARYLFLFFLVTLLAPLPAAALEQSTCLSRGEVKGANPRYHVIDGQKCWHAATSPAAQPAVTQPDATQPDPAQSDAVKPDAAKPAAAADEINVDPYGDPIWQQSAAQGAPRKPRRAKPSAVGGPLILNPSSAYTR